MQKTNAKNKMKIVMVDALVGSDYSLCLCSSLKATGMDVRLVVTEDRSENTRIPLTFPLLKWSPPKEATQSKLAKSVKYVRYLVKLLTECARNKPDIVHFQFFRRERIESLFFAVLRLVIAGSPLNEALRNRYERKIDAMAVKERITYHANFIANKEVATYFTAADAVVLPYRNIYHSGVLHLAYSFGKPVIATRVGDFPETIEHGKTGFLVDTTVKQALANTISEAFSHIAALARMGQNARKQSETKYSWENVALKTRQTYSMLARNSCVQQPQQVIATAPKRV